VVATVGVLILVLTVQIAIEDPGIETDWDDTDRDDDSRSDDLVIDRITVLTSGARDLGREAVVFENPGERQFDLSGVTVRSDRGHEYTFDWGVGIASGASLTLVTGDVPERPGVVSWGATEPIWSGESERIVVADVDGVTLVDAAVSELAAVTDETTDDGADGNDGTDDGR
jgi:hypothetical protein